jgi:SAM-dependent methyltransferase
MAARGLPTVEAGQACWVCGSGETLPWKERALPSRLAPDDLRITDSRYGVTLALRRCEACGFVFAEPDADLSRLTQLYEDLDDPEYDDTAEPRALQMRWLLRETRRHAPQARSVLDVGAGTGLLVAEATAAGLDAVGVEPSRALVDAGRAHGRDGLVQGSLPRPELAGRLFDLVFLVDVIEHVADPVELLGQCADRVAPGGLLVVVTPDLQSVPARLLGRRWWHLRVAHVGYFARASLTRAAARIGFAPAAWTRARWFFRVSYLAERAARYLPVGWINRLAEKVGALRALYDLVIPLNLHDSWVVVLRRERPTTRLGS